MFLGLAAVLIVLWVLGYVFFKVTKGVIHVLLVIAVVAIAWHFLKGG